MTWDAFLEHVSGLAKEELPLERLLKLVRQIDFTKELIEPFKNFTGEKYCRTLMVKNHLFEAVCMGWEPDQRTVIHNHGDSFGVFYVYEGELFFNTFDRKDDGKTAGKCELGNLVSDRAMPGEYASAAIGDIHEMGNFPDHKGRTVSIHFYAGPMEQMEVFDIGQGTVESVVLPYYRAPEERLA